MALPQLTDEQRAAALEKAAAARRARAELKERLKRGGTDLKQVLADAEEDNRRLGRSDTGHGTCVSLQRAAVTSVTTYAEIAPPPLA